MKNIAIFPNTDRDKNLTSTKEVVELVKASGKNVLMDVCFQNAIAGVEFLPMSAIMERADLIVALGGDGTILKIVKDAAEANVPIVGINLGHLGFLTQAEKDDLSVFEKVFNGEFSISNNMMLEARLIRDGAITEKYTALNDVILSGEAAMISVEAEVNGISASKYLADGMIIATSTGSTAYSLSCGGPIINPSLDCIILTPICPHSLKSRCIVIPPKDVVRIRINEERSNKAILRVDGTVMKTLKVGDIIEICCAEKRAPLINLNDRNYFDVIREKLSD